MVDYNFTVRATDNQGAFSDRTFSITVNNTQLERYVLVGSTGLIHSPNGTTWNVEGGLSGQGVEWCNAYWVVWNTMMLRTSTDAFNWSTYTPTWPTVTVSGVTYTPSSIYRIKYKKGAYYAFLAVSGDAGTTCAEYISNDLVNWTGTGRLLAPPNTWVHMNDFEYDAGSDTWVACGYNGNNGSTIFSRVGNGSWTARQATTGQLWGNYVGNVTFINGTWIATLDQTQAVVYTSVDAVTWTSRPVVTGFAAVTTSMLYLNGKLVTTITRSGNANKTAYTSTNGGRTWNAEGSIQSGTASANYPQMRTAMRQMQAWYAGGLITIEPSNSLRSFAFQPDVGQAPTYQGDKGIGEYMGVAARNT